MAKTEFSAVLWVLYAFRGLEKAKIVFFENFSEKNQIIAKKSKMSPTVSKDTFLPLWTKKIGQNKTRIGEVCQC